MFIRNERSIKEFIQLYPIVSILVTIHILLWAVISLLSLPFGHSLLSFGIGSNYMIAIGEYWRLVTPIFFHGDLTHMLFNSFSLVLFGPALEQMLGKIKFLFAYFGAGIIANIATFFLEPVTYLHLGASGAIFGLFGIYLYMTFFRKELMDQGSIQVVGVIIAISLVMTFIRADINVIAHLFGMIGGFILAPLLLNNVRPYIPGGYRKRKVLDDDEIGFDPDRWR